MYRFILIKIKLIFYQTESLKLFKKDFIIKRYFNLILNLKVDVARTMFPWKSAFCSSPGVICEIVLLCLHEGDDLLHAEVGAGQVGVELTACKIVTIAVVVGHSSFTL